MNIKENIAQWTAPVLAEAGLFLVEVRTIGKSKVEVFVDGENGVDINQCALISRLIEKNLDGSGFVSDNYTLDVSSPGMTNPLKVPQQYKKRIGQVLDVIKTDGTAVEGKLIAADENSFVIEPIVKVKKTKGKKVEELPASQPISLRYAETKKVTIQFKW